MKERKKNYFFFVLGISALTFQVSSLFMAFSLPNLFSVVYFMSGYSVPSPIFLILFVVTNIYLNIIGFIIWMHSKNIIQVIIYHFIPFIILVFLGQVFDAYVHNVAPHEYRNIVVFYIILYASPIICLLTYYLISKIISIKKVV